MITKKSLSREIAIKHDMALKDAEELVDSIITEIRLGVERGEEVCFRELFTIKPILRKAKKARYIREGVEVEVKAHYTPKAKFSTHVRNAVRKNLKVEE